MKKNAAVSVAKAAVPVANAGGGLPVDVLAGLNAKLKEIDALLAAAGSSRELSAEERRRWRGPGVRRYGFITMASKLSQDHPEFMPANLGGNSLADEVQQIVDFQLVQLQLVQFARQASDVVFRATRSAYRLALLYYDSVQMLARMGVPGAEVIGEELRSYFERPARKGGQPTVKQLKRDMNALLQGRKDGEIVVKNRRPEMVGGVHEVETKS